MKLHKTLYAPDTGVGTGTGGASTATTPPASAPASETPASSPKEIFGGVEDVTAPATGKTPAIETLPPAAPLPGATPPPASGTTPPAGGTTPPASVTPAPAGVTMTDDQLTKLAQSMVAGLTPKPAADDPNKPLPPMTPEEQVQFDKTFNVVRVTPETFQGIMGFAPENPAQLKALETFSHNIVKQAGSMLMYQVNKLMESKQQALESRLNPVLSAHSQQQSKVLEDQFYTDHADLKDFGPLVAEVSASVKASGAKFKTAKEAIDFVANKARTLLGKSAPTGTSPGAGGPAASQQKKVTMPPASMGGRLSSAGSPPETSGPKSVFGDMDAAR